MPKTIALQEQMGMSNKTLCLDAARNGTTSSKHELLQKRSYFGSVIDTGIFSKRNMKPLFRMLSSNGCLRIYKWKKLRFEYIFSHFPIFLTHFLENIIAEKYLPQEGNGTQSECPGRGQSSNLYTGRIYWFCWSLQMFCYVLNVVVYSFKNLQHDDVCGNHNCSPEDACIESRGVPLCVPVYRSKKLIFYIHINWSFPCRYRLLACLGN